MRGRVTYCTVHLSRTYTLVQSKNICTTTILNTRQQRRETSNVTNMKDYLRDKCHALDCELADSMNCYM